MKAISLFFLIVASGVESLVCPDGQLECGSAGCYDPTIQGCSENNNGIQCLNPCYVDSSPDPVCYNPSTHVCSDNKLCELYLSCGGQCVNDFFIACARNQTRCPGFHAWSYYYYYSNRLDVCGPQQQCYDNTMSVCLNGTRVCDGLNPQLCGTECFNPDLRICVNGTIACRYPCYVDSSPDPVCYNPSTHVCSDNKLCELYLSCGGQCVNDFFIACAKNQTRCPGFHAWSYYYYYSNRLDVCGPQQQCYDNTMSVCLNGTRVCDGLNPQLCGTECFNPDLRICVNGTIACRYPCYVDSSPDPVCYNPSTHVCSDNKLCELYLSCGGQCVNDFFIACAKNQTRCPGFHAWSYYYYYSNRLDVCGPQQQCYDNTMSVCLNGTMICSIGSQFCSGVCYDPHFYYCEGGNNTIYCLANPSSPNCPSATTTVPSTTTTVPSTTTTVPSSTTTVPSTTTTIPSTTTTVPSTTTTVPSTSQFPSTTMALTNVSDCCGAQECTTNSDCCRSGSLECQCYRHTPRDVYGSCLNPYTIPICAEGCPVESKCKFDSDCCKCQCAEVTITDFDGQSITKNRCVRR